MPASEAGGAVVFDERRIDAIFAEVDQCRLPGAVVGIAIDGRPVYRKGFGLARMELPVVLSPSMRVRIGSTTKHFTAFAFMLMCEDGRAHIDDPVGKFFPELHPVTHRVTMRQLMANTSGLRDAYDIALQFSGLCPSVASADLLALYRDIDDVNAAPGETWIYNNGGWLLLSAVIERLTGQPLEDVFRERIFEPVGMHDTLLRRWDTEFVSNSATPHMMNAVGRYEKWDWMDWTGAGAVVSTVDDMLRWLAHMSAPVVGGKATWAAMTAPQVLANQTSIDYGLGLITSRYRGLKTIYNPGGWLGGACQMLKAPDVGLDVVVIVNRFDANVIALTDSVIDACVPDLGPVVEHSRAACATGTFLSPRTGRVVQLFGRDGVQIASICGSDQPFEPHGHGVMRLMGGFGFEKPTLTLQGDLLRFDEFGNVDEFHAVPVAGSGSISGKYRADSTGTEATISETTDGARLRMSGRFGAVLYDLECLASGIWRARSPRAVIPPGGVLAFDPTGFRYSTSQTWGLSFRRCA
jgi:D-aminopeptidase